MKALLRLISSLTLCTTVAPLASGQSHKTQNNAQHYAISVPLNYDYYVTGGSTSFWTYDVSVVTLVHYSSYAKSWNDFAQKYTHLRLLNFYARVWGQTDDQSVNNFEYSTNNLPWYSPDMIVQMDSTPWGIGHQIAQISVKFIENNGWLMAKFHFYTKSTNCSQNVHAGIDTSDALFYN